MIHIVHIGKFSENFWFYLYYIVLCCNKESCNCNYYDTFGMFGSLTRWLISQAQMRTLNLCFRDPYCVYWKKFRKKSHDIFLVDANHRVWFIGRIRQDREADLMIIITIIIIIIFKSSYLKLLISSHNIYNFYLIFDRYDFYLIKLN